MRVNKTLRGARRLGKKEKINITETCFFFSWLSGTIIAKAGIQNKEKAVAMASDRKSNTLADGKMLFVTHR